MNTDTKARFRFSELVFAIVIVVVGLVWAERLAWNQITTLRAENQAFIQTLKTEDAAAAANFLATANASLTQLQRFLFVALLCLLASGATLVVLAYKRMITPLRNTLTESRAIIERQEKLASLGVFATGIAHEIRNPLTAIKVRLFSLKQSFNSNSSEVEDVQVIESEIERLERIVKDFLQFARPAEPELRMVSLRKFLDEIEQLVAAELSHKSVTFDLQFEVEPGENVRIDPDKIKQVLLNLIRNGTEAISGAGRLTLRARYHKEVLTGEIKDVVAIDVVDTGCGMPLETQKRLFDPFFTTKEGGTGLGLPIAARIVEKHGGAIACATAPNQGTTFTIFLPRIPDAK